MSKAPQKSVSPNLCCHGHFPFSVRIPIVCTKPIVKCHCQNPFHNPCVKISGRKIFLVQTLRPFSHKVGFHTWHHGQCPAAVFPCHPVRQNPGGTLPTPGQRAAHRHGPKDLALPMHSLVCADLSAVQSAGPLRRRYGHAHKDITAFHHLVEASLLTGVLGRVESGCLWSNLMCSSYVLQPKREQIIYRLEFCAAEPPEGGVV